MENPTLLFLTFLVLSYFIYRSYIAWFQPEQMLNRILSARKKAEKIYAFMPKWWLSLGYWGDNKTTQLWWSRFISTTAVLLLILVLLIQFNVLP